MGLLVSNVSVKTKDGDTLTSFWAEFSSRTDAKPTPAILLSVEFYRSEADLDAGAVPLALVDTGAGLATDVPGYLKSISDGLTPVQYANVDLTQAHNQLRDLYIEGDAHARWAELVGVEKVWAGFGVGNVVTQMPV